jgi:hypothetical protein
MQRDWWGRDGADDDEGCSSWFWVHIGLSASVGQANPRPKMLLLGWMGQLLDRRNATNLHPADK